MSLPALDNFNRANENPITGPSGTTWTGVQNNHQVISNACQGNTFSFSLSYWSADVFTTDQYAQLKVINLSDGGPAVRVSGSSGSANSYHFDCKSGAGNSVLQKIIVGSFTNLQTGLTITNGDTSYLEVIGTTLKCKVNGVQVGTNSTDSSLSSGSAGIFNFDTTGQYDDFQADQLGGGIPVLNNERPRGASRPAPFCPGGQMGAGGRW